MAAFRKLPHFSPLIAGLVASLFAASIFAASIFAASIFAASLFDASSVVAGEYRHARSHAHHHRDRYDDYNYFRQSYVHGQRHIVVANHHQRPGKPRSVFVDPVGYDYPAIKYRTQASGYQQLPEPPTTRTPAARRVAPVAPTAPVAPIAPVAPQ